MPTYDYYCDNCGWRAEWRVPLADYTKVLYCAQCGARLIRQISASHIKIAGRVLQGGGPDRFTADMIGCRVDELPSGLRTEQPPI